MAYSALAVANEMLRQARASDPPRSLTPLQLLKLVYIANGWALGLRGAPLVRENAEAWTYGPVIPALYREVRQYRAMPISQPIEGALAQESIEPDDMDLISAVYKAYSHLSGPQLSNLTHLPETPWSVTWNDGRGQNNIIPQHLIVDHYKMLSERSA